jgi:hypothetical protein
MSKCDRCDLNQPFDLSFGHFHLRRDGHLRVISTRHTRRAAASELMGTQTRKNGELEAVRLNGTMNHANHPHSKALVRAGPERPRAQKSRRLIIVHPPTRSCAKSAQRRSKHLSRTAFPSVRRTKNVELGSKRHTSARFAEFHQAPEATDLRRLVPSTGRSRHAARGLLRFPRPCARASVIL